jgi:hypothetical protein
LSDDAAGVGDRLRRADDRAQRALLIRTGSAGTGGRLETRSARRSRRAARPAAVVLSRGESMTHCGRRDSRRAPS